MKGFGIEIKNNLLEPKHIEKMGSAVWLYMFLVDKMTSINEKGIGKVLGGKPIKYEEVEKELGISRDTYTRWVNKLVSYPYIEAIRTPYGISFNVFKAYKQFGNRVRENAESVVVRESAKSRKRIRKTSESLRENAESNKTVQLDSTVDKANEATQALQKEDINSLIELFKNVNPSYEMLFPNKTQRSAMTRLLKKYGKEKCERIVGFLPKIVNKPYAPRITTPLELEKNLGKLIIFFNQEKGKESSKKMEVHIVQ